MSFATRGRLFERTVQRALERHGFSLRLTAAGPDGGVDLIGDWVLGQRASAQPATLAAGTTASTTTSPATGDLSRVASPRRVPCVVQCKYQVWAVLDVDKPFCKNRGSEVLVSNWDPRLPTPPPPVPEHTHAPRAASGGRGQRWHGAGVY